MFFVFEILQNQSYGFLHLYQLGTWIGQGDGVGTGNGNRQSLGSKPREPLFLFYFNILLYLRDNCPFI